MSRPPRIEVANGVHHVVAGGNERQADEPVGGPKIGLPPDGRAWDSLKPSLKGELEDSVWDHLAGTTSAPFEAGENDEIEVKVIDDRGNELLVVKKLSEAE